MGNRAEQLRKELMVRGDPLYLHPMNQKMLKSMKERQGRFSHPNGKEAKAERRRWEQKQFLQDLPKSQFYRALGNVFNGMPLEDTIDLAPENIAYVVKHIGEYERGIKTYNTEKETKVSITIVEFTRQDNTIARRDIAT